MSIHKGVTRRVLAITLSLSMVFSGTAILKNSNEVKAKKVKVKSLSLTKPVIKTLALKKGESFSLKYKVKPTKGTLKFSSSKKSVVTVSKKGKLKAKKAGSATVTIASKSKPKKSVKLKVTVLKKLTKASSVAFTSDIDSVSVGETIQLTTKVNPEKASVKKVTYVSKDASVATVNASGVVTGKKEGQTVITAYANDGRGAKGIQIVTVTAAKVAEATPEVTATPVPADVTRAPWETIAPTPSPTPEPPGPELKQADAGNFTICSGDAATDLYIDKNAKDYDGISLVAKSFCDDVKRVSTKAAKPYVYTDKNELRQSAIIAGSIGNNDVIDKLIADKKIDVSDIKGKNEVYKIQVVDNPTDKCKLGLVVVGSDKRGTMYGIFSISEKIGVSPWVYWADVEPVAKDKFSFAKDSYKATSKEPSVKYRGIFLNDEAPSLTGWVKKKFGNYNEKFYVNVYELIIRCKGNYLWPAMWSNNFSEDGKSSKIANAELADKYGVVMGTSHHEAMCRAGVEWQQKYKTYGKSNKWDFNTNAEALTKFWEDGIKRNKPYENVITLGMRGEADSALGGGIPENIQLLKNIITTQKKLLKDNGLEKAPQVLTVYKEVEDFWHGTKDAPGLKKWSVLDDVIIMLCDDNFGNMRTLPEGDQITRKGGWGMYYHFDYHGGPVSYEWVNTTQLNKVWEQMSMAYEHGIDDIWIVNVGDLKPMEMNISYFLDLAYDYDTWGKNGENKTDDYRTKWVEQQFGQDLTKDQQKDVKSLLEEYTWINTSCKPEVVSSGTYSVTNYNEARRVLNRLEAAMKKADNVEKIIPDRLKAAYFQLVYYPVVASANVAKMQICSGLNQFFYNAKSAAANFYGSEVTEAIALDKVLEGTYNNSMPGVGNKWINMMSSPHVGYVTWESKGWKYPEAKKLTLSDTTAKMTVYAEDNANVVSSGTTTLPDFTNVNNETYTVTVSNTGGKAFDYKVQPKNDWIKVSQTSGNVTVKDEFTVSVDWSKVKTNQTGSVEVTAGSDKVTITVNAKVYDVTTLAENTYIYANGYASILPGRYTKSQDSADGVTVKVMNGYGKMEESLKAQPAVKRYASDVSKAPYVEYSVSVPSAGDYKVNVYSAPSSNLERDDVSINFGISANDGTVKKINTIDSSKYAPGTYSCSWPTDVRNNGRKTETTMTLKAGVNTIRIYAADPGFVLQKIVVAKDGVKASHLGPQESYFVPKK